MVKIVFRKSLKRFRHCQKNSRRLELSISENTRHGRMGSRFAFPGAFWAEMLDFVAFGASGKIVHQNFPGLSQSFPREPPNRPRKQPQPSPRNPQIPPNKFMWVPSLRSFPGDKAHKLFFWRPKTRDLGWGSKKFMLKKFMCFFFSVLYLFRMFLGDGLERFK